MPKDERGGFATNWEVGGTGARKALMIHCSLANQRAWNGIKEQLEDLATFTSFDLPGHGKSGDWVGRGEFQEVSTAIAKDLLNGPSDLIGHSFGATVALRLALENPGLVRSLTLIEPVYFFVAQGAVEADAHLEEYAKLVKDMRAGEKETATREFSHLWGDGTPWEEQGEKQRASAIKRIHLILAHSPAIYEDIGGVLPEGRLEQLDIPVLLIDGAMSPPVIGVIQMRLLERLQNAKRITVEDARHMVPITHPVEVAVAIRNFWAEYADG